MMMDFSIWSVFVADVAPGTTVDIDGALMLLFEEEAAFFSGCRRVRIYKYNRDEVL